MSDIITAISSILDGEYSEFSVDEYENKTLARKSYIFADIRQINPIQISLGETNIEEEIVLDYLVRYRTNENKNEFLASWDRIIGKLLNSNKLNNTVYEFAIKSRQIDDIDSYRHVVITIMTKKEE